MSPEKRSLDDLRIDRSEVPERKGAGRIVLALLVLVAAGIGIYFFAGPRTTEVRTFTIRDPAVGNPDTVLNASGYVTPRRQATVSAKVTGKVIDVLVEEGMAVAEGQILARLDPANVLAQLRLAEAQFETVESALRETEVRLDEATREFGRISGLAADRISSPAELDRAQAEVNSLQARLERQAVEVKVAERQVALWEQQLEDTIIRAPFSGVVVSKDAQPGEMISPVSAGGGFTRTGICTLVDMESLEIEVDVNESFINRVKPDQPAGATLDAYPEWNIPARVIAIIPTADRQRATVRVRVGFEALDPRILPQMGVKVAFKNPDGSSNESEKGVAIPNGAVYREDGRDLVWVVRDGRVESRAVELGASDGQETAIRTGLSAGDRVVVDGGEKLANGARVREVNR